MRNHILFWVAVTMLITGCQGKLSRSKAKSEIIKAKQLPYPEYKPLNKRFIKEHQYVEFGKVCFNNINLFKDYASQLLEMQSKGYITLKDDTNFDNCNNRYTNVILTESGKKELVKEDPNNYYIRVSTIDFGEVTGIVEYKVLHAADVNYTLVREDLSEFGAMVTKLSNNNPNLPITINHLTNFQKSDNGWHIIQ